MGARGAIGTPDRVKSLTGNPGKRPLTQNNPQPDRTPPTCPDWLDPIAQAKWAELSPELIRLGLLTLVDGDSFAAYCQAYAEFQLATKDLSDEGRVCVTRTGYLAPHPAISMQRSAWEAMKKFSAMFGLDPASRARMNVAPAAEEEDPFEKFLGGSN